MESEPLFESGNGPDDCLSRFGDCQRADFAGITVQPVAELLCGFFIQIAHPDGQSRPDQAIQIAVVGILLFFRFLTLLMSQFNDTICSSRYNENRLLIP